MAARKLATLDHLSGGRTAVHMITGGNDAEQARDGDFTDHDARYRRTQEYVPAARTWTAPAPFDHQEFYRVVGAYARHSLPASAAYARLRRRRLPCRHCCPGRGHRRDQGNSTALVGTPETVAEALTAYYDLWGNKPAHQWL